MAEPPKPHTVPRKRTGEAVATKKPVEARPTSKLDKNELLGLVGTMRTPVVPAVVPYDADAEVEIEKTTDPAPPVPSRAVANVEKRVVRTVARRTPIAGMAPIKVEPVAPPPVAPKPAADEYVDLFAEGSDHSIDVGPVAAPAVVEPPPAVVEAEAAPAVEVVEVPAEPVAPAPTLRPSKRTLQLAVAVGAFVLLVLLVAILR